MDGIKNLVDLVQSLPALGKCVASAVIILISFLLLLIIWQKPRDHRSLVHSEEVGGSGDQIASLSGPSTRVESSNPPAEPAAGFGSAFRVSPGANIGSWQMHDIRFRGPSNFMDVGGHIGALHQSNVNIDQTGGHENELRIGSMTTAPAPTYLQIPGWERAIELLEAPEPDRLPDGSYRNVVRFRVRGARQPQGIQISTPLQDLLDFKVQGDASTHAIDIRDRELGLAIIELSPPYDTYRISVHSRSPPLPGVVGFAVC